MQLSSRDYGRLSFASAQQHGPARACVAPIARTAPVWRSWPLDRRTCRHGHGEVCIACLTSRIVTTKSRRRPIWAEKAAAEVLHAPCSEGAVQPSTPREVERVIAQPPANDDRKPAMATKPTLVTTTCSPATDSGRSHGRYKRRQAGGIGSGCLSVAGHSDLGGWRGAEGYVPRQRVRAGMAGMAITTTGRSYVRRVKGFIPRSRPL